MCALKGRKHVRCLALSGLGFCDLVCLRRGGAGGMASLADRCAFIIPSSAGQVIQVGASRRDVVRADRPREESIVKREEPETAKRGSKGTGKWAIGLSESAMAKRTHRVVSPRPQSRQAGLCPMRRMGRRERGNADCGFVVRRPRSAIANTLPSASPLNKESTRDGVLPNPKSEIRDPKSDQLLSSLSAFSSRVSMLKGLLM